MRYKIIIIFFALIAVAAITAFVTPTQNSLASSVVPSATPRKPAKTKTADLTYTEGEYDGKAITRTEAEWKQALTPAAFYVLRKEGTEKPYSGALNNNKKKGTYYCAACGLALFDSNAKYDSETGWPSFFQLINKKNVTEKTDNLLSEPRTEVECARCGSHIGHVFDDGPKPTGLRYCMNSVALKFKPRK